MIVFATNINTGGALVLLQELANRFARARLPATFYVSPNILNNKPLPSDEEGVRFAPGKYNYLWDRDGTEAKLYFGNLPPLRPSPNSAVYVHNAYFSLPLSALLKGVFRRKISARYLLLTAYFSLFHRNCSSILVQTDCMQKTMQKKCARPVRIMPFYRSASNQDTVAVEKTTTLCAIGLPSRHKLYAPFLTALNSLLAQGYPLLIEMTIPDLPQNRQLLMLIDDINHKEGSVVIHNHGLVDFETIKGIYARSRALFFPSLCESFGLPLIEAAECGLQVFAPDLPYVNDVIENHICFNPESEQDIAEKIQAWINQGAIISPAIIRVEDCGEKLVRGDWHE